MANEAVIIELLGFERGTPVQYTCAEGTTILKGTLMELSGDRTVRASTTVNVGFVGIAAHEKASGDGSTTITVYTNGIFNILSDSGTDVVGTTMAISATENTISTATGTELLDGSVVGYYLEAGTNAGTEAVRILK